MYDDNNVFNKIINGAVPVKKLYEDDFLIAFADKTPVAPIHILVIPKGKYKDFSDFVLNAGEKEIAHYYSAIARIAKENGAEEYRLVTNRGAASGQSVFHFHTHIIAGKKILPPLGEEL